MSAIRLVATVAASLACLAVTSPAVAAPDTSDGVRPASSRQVVPDERRIIGTTVGGRPIVARHVGDPAAPVQLVVLGEMHGNESGGRRVVARLAKAGIPDGLGLWLVTSMNPDGHAAGTRTNARGVDLNRNFPVSWRRAGASTGQWSGPAAASERETRALVRFLTAVQPTGLISYHQAYDVVDISQPRSRRAGRLLARWMGERTADVGCSGRNSRAAATCHGNLTQWVDRRLGAIALTVELDRQVSRAEARRAAEAVLRLGVWLGR